MIYPRRISRALIVIAYLAILAIVVNVCGGIYLGEAAEQQQIDRSQGVTIVVTYPYDSSTCDLTDIEEIQAAINEISLEEIGVEVELRPVNSKDAYDSNMRKLSCGETVDLMYVEGGSINRYIDAGLLQSVSGYLKRDMTYLFIKNQLYRGSITSGATQQGKIYGVTDITENEAVGYGLWISEAVLNDVGVNYQPNHIYSYDEIEQIMASLKEKYPDDYPLGQITANQTDTSGRYYTALGNPLGDTCETGVVTQDSDVVENFYTTEAYTTFLTYMQSWYQQKYIFADSAIYTNGVVNLLKGGKVFMMPGDSQPDTMDRMLGTKNDYVCLQMVEPVTEAPSSVQGYWTLPATSRYLQQAMNFLNLLYSSSRISNLLCYGIEGEHYVVTDRAYHVIQQKEKTYYFPTASFGAQENKYTFQNKYQQEISEKYNQQAIGIDARYQGFTFNTSSVIKEEFAVASVVKKYGYILESGSVDLEGNYQDFLRELQEAGIDKILQEKQRQLDLWLQR